MALKVALVVKNPPVSSGDTRGMGSIHESGRSPGGGIYIYNIQFSSVAQSCLTLCDPMDCSTPDFPVHHQLQELTQTHVHRVSDAIQPSHPVFPFSSHLQSFPASGFSPMSLFFTSGGQSILAKYPSNAYSILIEYSSNIEYPSNVAYYSAIQRMKSCYF